MQWKKNWIRILEFVSSVELPINDFHFQTKQYASDLPKGSKLAGGWMVPITDACLFSHVTDAGLLLIGGQKPGKTTWQIMAYHVKVNPNKEWFCTTPFSHLHSDKKCLVGQEYTHMYLQLEGCPITYQQIKKVMICLSLYQRSLVKSHWLNLLLSY